MPDSTENGIAFCAGDLDKVDWFIVDSLIGEPCTEHGFDCRRVNVFLLTAGNFVVL